MINIYGDIDTEAFSKFDAELHCHEAMGDTTIHINLMSDGGFATIGLAFYDRIRSSRCHTVITAYGEVGSAAVLVFLAGDERIMAPNSYLYLHEESSAGVEDIPLSRSRRQLRRLQIVDDQYNKLMSLPRCSNLTIKEIDEMNKKETLLSPDKCLKYNLCHKIMTLK